jgi:basic membrane protein A and related proteins
MSRAEVALLSALLLVACRGPEAPPPPKGAPTPFPVAFVYSGAPGDQGWVDAQERAREGLEAKLDWVHTTVRAGISPDTALETLDTLASDGWRLIIVASPALRAATEAAAASQPGTTFLLVGAREGDGVSTRDAALETVRYLAGVAAGVRAQADERPVVGCVVRGDDSREHEFVDAAARGVRDACPECRILTRGIGAGGGPAEDVAAIGALYEAGADVVFAGTGGEAALAAVPDGRWLVARALGGPCAAAPTRCLTATTLHWDWTYDSAVKRVNDGSWKPGRELLDAKTGAVGLLGFMDREPPPPGIPAATIAAIRTRFDQMKRGEGLDLTGGTTPLLEEIGVEER